MSLLGKAKGWLGKKRSESTDRVTRASSPNARVSYNDDVVPPELLEETNSVRAMTYPCQEFLEAAGIKEEFDNLCANAGLTRLATCRAPQYHRLTSCFINNFRYNHSTSTVEFRIYNDLFTMPLSRFCEIIGVPNTGKTIKMNSHPSELRTLFNSLCNEDLKDIQRLKISSILFPHIRYFAYFIA